MNRTIVFAAMLLMAFPVPSALAGSCCQPSQYYNWGAYGSRTPRSSYEGDNSSKGSAPRSGLAGVSRCQRHVVEQIRMFIGIGRKFGRNRRWFALLADKSPLWNGFFTS